MEIVETRSNNPIRFPKIIHQTWNDSNVPNRYLEFIDDWKIMHPDWKFNLWTHEMNDKYVAENFPEFLPVYNGYTHQIQRIDAARYLILYKLGGVHIDLDIQCFKNVEPLLEGDFEFVIGMEPEEHCIDHNQELILSNAFMASVPDGGFLKCIISSMLNGFGASEKRPVYSILHTTGPMMLTNLYLAYPQKEKIKVLESFAICPLTKEEIYGGKVDLENHPKLSKAFALHYFEGLWLRS